MAKKKSLKSKPYHDKLKLIQYFNRLKPSLFYLKNWYGKSKGTKTFDKILLQITEYLTLYSIFNLCFFQNLCNLFMGQNLLAQAKNVMAKTLSFYKMISSYYHDMYFTSRMKDHIMSRSDSCMLLSNILFV